MDDKCHDQPQKFRLWIATYSEWRPAHWYEAPPRAIALEPVDDVLYDSERAALILEGFNRSMLEHDQPIWAVALPITVSYEGDARPGMPVEGYQFSESQLAALAEIKADDSFSGGIGRDHFQGLDQSPQRSR